MMVVFDKRVDHRSNDQRRSGGGAPAVNARNASVSSVSRLSANAQASTSSANDTSGLQSFLTSRPDEARDEMPDALNMDQHATKKYLANLSSDACQRLGVMRKNDGMFEMGTVRFAILARSLVEDDMTSRIVCARIMIQVKAYEQFVNGRKMPKQINLQRRAFDYTTKSSDVFDHFYQGGVTTDELLDAGGGAMVFLKVSVVQDNGHNVPNKLREIITNEYLAKEGFQWVVKGFFWMSRRARVAKEEYQKENVNPVIIEDVDNDMEEYESFA
jgi:hypothetical protein